MNTPVPINIDSVLELILTALNDIVDYELAVILKKTDNSTLTVQKAMGPLKNEKMKDYSINLGLRRDMAEKLNYPEPYLFPEEDDHEDTYEEILDMPNGHSCLISPLHSEGAPIGLLTLDHRQCHMFSPQIIRFVGTISRMIEIILSQSDASSYLLSQQKSLLEERNRLLTERAEEFRSVIGESPAWNIVLELIRTVAASDLPVLIQGETGTGKEQAAQLIHRLSTRRDRPFIALNCSALSAGLAESELFGHEKGAFTSAVTQRKGRFELAHGGTLFLDEIGDLPPEVQPKLLRTLQEGSFERVGGEKTLRTDVRVIAASHVNLKEAVEKGSFREDLYYRLGVFPIGLPPLRERGEDIILLAEHFLDQIRTSGKYPGVNLSSDGVQSLLNHDWPGNVRELQNVIRRAALIAGGGSIGRKHLSLEGGNPNKSLPQLAPPEKEGAFPSLDEAMAGHIKAALERTKGKIYGKNGAAELLDMKPTTLQSRMKKLGI
ncbi:MAG: sigma 54-interacting transcriptional regulator [Spirochaetales bacterium]|nr:sigma 54-interacting transcriptional regulator [Spirochaetales bacterium]